MKKFNSNFAALCGFALLSTVLTLSSCNSSEEVKNLEELETNRRVPVCVHVSEFSFSMEDLPSTRATETPASYEELDVITLAFYDGTTEVYTATQLRSDASAYTTFGDFSCELPIGNYTMIVIGRDDNTGDVFTLTGPTEAGYTSERVRETFAAMQSVEVTGTSVVSLSVTLDRIVTRLGIYSTDLRPAGVSAIRTTYSAGSKSFNPSTGLALGNSGFSTTNSPSAGEGETIRTGSFAFLATDEQTMDITLEVLDNDNQVIISKVIHDVPFKRNRLTALHGPVFTPAATSVSFTLETDWLNKHDVNF